MPKKAYIGISDKARQVKNIYIGVNNVAKKVIKAYVGDANGKARQWWPSAIVKKLFTKLYGIDNYDFNPRSTISPSVQPELKEYTAYYTGDFGTAFRYKGFTCFNLVDSTDGNMGPLRPIKYIREYDDSTLVWKLEVPGNYNSSNRWWLCIPVLLFGLSQLDILVTGSSYNVIVGHGVATRVSDDTVETPTFTGSSYGLGSGTTTLTWKFNDIRADYIYLSGYNFFGSDKITIREITVTYQRAYGKVYKTDPLSGLPIVLNVNFPKFGYSIGGSYAELLVTAASSAVYMLIYTSNNDFVGNHEYTDIENGDTWGTGTTFVIFISKNTFTLNWCQGTNIGPAQTINSASYSGKTTYYFYYVLPIEVHTESEPMYNHAYNIYNALDWNNIPTAIAGLGNSILYEGPIQ